MPNVWYSADLHIGHKLVSGLRGYKNEFVDQDGVKMSEPDPEAWNNALAETWDKTVKKDDIVYVLGDISINGGQHALDWIAARPGTKHLIAGNHDPVGPWDRRSPKLLRHWMEYFESVQPSMRRRLEGRQFLLSHFPYEEYGDGEEREGSRYNQYRLPDHGVPLLYGHVHSKETERTTSKGTPTLHVGLDAWEHRLVPQEVVMEWLDRTSQGNKK